jgi:aspartate/methionine/tyrosine aminotransferase
MKRPNGHNSNTVPLTQFYHEWVHELSARGFEIADGSRGKPSFPKDEFAEKAILDFVKNAGAVFPYGTNAVGEKKFREQAALGFSKEYGINFSANEMIFTPGGQFGISAAFYLVEHLFPKSVIVSPKPWYLNHHDIACMFSSDGFNAIPNKDKFHALDILDSGIKRLSGDLIKTAIDECNKANKKIGAFLFCNPMNPMGQVTRKNEWQEIAKTLDKYPDSLILMDEAFAEIVFDNDYNCSILHTAPHLKDRMILFRSGTKALGYPGERLAVMSVPEKYLDILTAFQSRLLGSAPLTSQAGMAAAIANMSVASKKKISDYYFENYKFLKSKVAENKNLKIISEAEGGFYVLIDFSSFKGKKTPLFAKEILGDNSDIISTDTQLSISLMCGLLGDKKGIATIPASAFGADDKKLILRVSFSSNKDEINSFFNMLNN